MGIALCESDYCKHAKMTVGAHVLEIVMDNLSWCKIHIFFFLRSAMLNYSANH